MQFKILQQKIQNFIEKISSREDIFFVRDKLPVSDALFCAGDSLRNKKFYDAIGCAIRDSKRKYDIVNVIDAGAGIGVLGIFALMHGASHVTFIEENSLTAKILEQFLEELDLSSKSHIIREDVLNISKPPQHHLLISETIALDFSEDFTDIIRHLTRFLVGDGIIIPEHFDLNIVKPSREMEAMSFSSYNIPLKGDLEFPSGVEVSGKCTLYDTISVSSGECMSFCNSRVIK